MILYFSNELLSAKEKSILSNLKERYTIKFRKSYNVILNNDPNFKLKIEKRKNKYILNYGSTNYLLRGIGKLLAVDDLTHYEENENVHDFRLMLDCSRNAAPKVETHKKIIMQLALLGYTTYSLYLEDMYEVKSYPAFGLFRGCYSKEELREIDDFASIFDMKVVASIQTLGHLSQLFHYRYFDKVKDTQSNLLVDEEETYKLIDKMIETISSSLRTREIMIGMDEVHSLGKGAYIDKFGYEKQFPLFIKHLKKVCDICHKYGYAKPTVWSDMFIKLQSKTHSYLDLDVEIDPEIKNLIPNCKLGYWDYDTIDTEVVDKMLDIHFKLSDNISLVTGLTTWFTPFYKHWKSKHVLDCFSESMKTNNIDDFMLTIWGDDGAYCHPDSYILGIYHLAERVYTNDVDVNKFNKLFNLDYDKMELCSYVDPKVNGDLKRYFNKTFMSFAHAFFDDPIYGIGFKNEDAQNKNVLENTYNHYLQLVPKLEQIKDENHLYNLTYLFAKCCLLKISSRIELIDCYFNNKEMSSVIEKYKEIILIVKEINYKFSKMWLQNYKTYGIDVMTGRFAAMVDRYKFSISYLKKYQNKVIKSIPELEELKKELPYVRIKDFYCNLAVITINR